MISIDILGVGSYICLLGYRNKGAGVNRVPGPESDGRACLSELGKGGGWVIGVTVGVLGSVEGGTLVFVQRDTILDAQRQVGLEVSGS